VRNVYLLINPGSWASDNITSFKLDANVQLLSTTDPGSSHSDFVLARLNGTDTSSSNSGGSSGLGNGAIIGIVLGAIALFTAAGLALFYFSFQKRHSVYNEERYRALDNPAPMAADDTHFIPLTEHYRDPYTDHIS
jgi:hypothetical protein